MIEMHHEIQGGIGPTFSIFKSLCSLLRRGLFDVAEIVYVGALLVREGRALMKSAYHKIQGGHAPPRKGFLIFKSLLLSRELLDFACT